MIKKLTMAILAISTFSQAKTSDLNITNNCEGLKLYNVVWKTEKKNWNGKRSSFLKYSLKNTLNKEISNIKVTTYLLGKNNHRIMESTNNEANIKAYYNKPMTASTYYGIAPAPAEFIGKGELVISCEDKVNKTTKKGFTDIHLPNKLFNNIKAKTKNQTELEARIVIYMTLSLIDKEGGLNKVAEKLK